MSLAAIAASQSGISGFSSRIGRGASSLTLRNTAMVELGAERRLPRAHRVEYAAEAEQVGTVVDGFAPRLLGRHVVRGAQDHTAVRDASVVDRPSQAEVGDLDALDAVLQ